MVFDLSGDVGLPRTESGRVSSSINKVQTDH